VTRDRGAASVWWLARLAVSAALVGWLLARVDAHAVARQIGDVGLATVATILSLQFLNTALKSYKWQRLLDADGIHLSHSTAFASYMISTFFSLFLPTSVGGDAVRAVDATRRSGRAVATVTSVIADRVLGFAAIGIVGLLALAAGSASALGARLLASGGALYVAVLLGSIALFAGWPLRAIHALGVSRLPRIERLVAGAARSLESYRRSGRLAELLLLSIAAQAIVVVAVYVIGHSLGMPVSLGYFFVIVPLVGLVESIPVSIYGIGLRDVSYVYLLGLAGVPKSQALSLSVLYVMITVVYALFGGLIFALRRPLAPVERVGSG
jgi:glycosyltransferase 2 family protein